jgi:RND family efflux transporter MFP subunit
MKKRLIIGIIVLAVIGLFFIFRRNSSSKPVEIEKVTLEQVEVSKTVSASGEVKANTELDLAFAAGGRINTLYVKKGAQVEEGQILADAVAVSNYNDIQALRDARDIAIRDKDIYIETYETKKEAVGGENEYYANIRRLDEIISRSNATYNSAINSLATMRIVSPANATVIDVLKEQDEVAVGGQTVLRIANLGDLVFKVSIDQEDFGFLKIDQPVLITLDSYKDITFSGKILTLPLFANSNGDFEVEIAIEPAKDALILLGMTGDAEIKIESTSDKVSALSFDAIYQEDDKSYVWIEENSKLKKKSVETGIEGDFYTQVKTDLSGVNVVIPTEDVELTEGQMVKYAKSN